MNALPPTHIGQRLQRSASSPRALRSATQGVPQSQDGPKGRAEGSGVPSLGIGDNVKPPRLRARSAGPSRSWSRLPARSPSPQRALTTTRTRASIPPVSGAWGLADAAKDVVLHSSQVVRRMRYLEVPETPTQPGVERSEDDLAGILYPAIESPRKVADPAALTRPLSRSGFAATNAGLSVSAACKATNDKIKPHLNAVLSKPAPRPKRLKRAQTLFAKLLRQASRDKSGGFLKVVRVVDISSFMQAQAEEKAARQKAAQELEAIQARAKAKKQAELERADKMRELWRNATRRPVSKAELKLRRLRESLAPEDWKHIMAGTDEWSRKLKEKKRLAKRDKIKRNSELVKSGAFNPDMLARKALEASAKVKLRRERAKHKARRAAEAQYRRKLRHTSDARRKRRQRRARAEAIRQQAIAAKAAERKALAQAEATETSVRADADNRAGAPHE